MYVCIYITIHASEQLHAFCEFDRISFDPRVVCFYFPPPCFLAAPTPIPSTAIARALPLLVLLPSPIANIVVVVKHRFT